MQFKQRALVPVLLGMIGLALYAFHQLMWTNGSDAWHGVFLASATLPTYMALFLAKGGAARTSSLLFPVQIVTVVGVVLAIGDWVALVAALLSFVALEWFVFVYSRYGRDKSDAITIGIALPSLTFETLDGERMASNDFRGSKTLLVFFRGNWCPLCMAQIRELIARAHRLYEAGVEVRLISNQSPEKSKELAQKLELPEHFKILYDADLKAAEKLGIVDLGGSPVGLKGYPSDTVMATIIALDAEGQVLFSDETNNYRVRPHPDVFLPVFDTMPTRSSDQNPYLPERAVALSDPG